MYALFQTLIFFVLFLAISLATFYIPTVFFFLSLIKKEKQQSDAEIITLSLSIGMVIFVLMTIILALLNIRNLFLPLIIGANIFAIFKYKLQILVSWKVFLKDKVLLSLIILGVLMQGFINFPSGYLYKDGIHFWSSQGHDGLWHVALMEEIKINFPPQNPIFAGEKLYNYHYLVDILMGEYYRIYPFFASLDLYFRFFPVIFSILIGLSVFAFVARWQGSRQAGLLAVFFTYFVGSFGYIVTFLRNGKIFAGETVFWASQQNTILGNPPHAISHGLLTTFFLAFAIYLKERKLIWLIVSFLLVSTLAGFKVSGGFVMLAGVAAAAIVDFLNHRRISLLILAALLGLSNFVTFKSMTSKDAATFLMFLPWWFIRTMVVDKLGWINMELARQHYISKGTWHAWLRVIQLESYAFAIFVLGNLGMRMLGFYAIAKTIISGKIFKDPLEAMLIATGLSGLLMVIFFVQKGLIYNNIQFIQYFLLIVGFYGAIVVYRLMSLFKKRWIGFCLMILVFVFSVPTVIGNLNEFYGPGTSSLAKIGSQDLEALQYLKKHTDKNAIILTMPFNKSLKDKFPSQPRPIYAWYSTAYIPAMTGRRVYLTGEEQALITGYPIDDRLSKAQRYFEQKDPSFEKKFIKDANISYIYIAKSEMDKPLDAQQNNLENFFENSQVVILKVLN